MVFSTYRDVHRGLASRTLTRSIDPARYERDNVVEGVVLMLDGAPHRERRALENALFRRDILTYYERELFPRIIAATLDPIAGTGSTDLVQAGSLLAIVLSARTAGVDVDDDSIEEREQLIELATAFTRAVALDVVVTGEEEIRAASARALREFTDTFLRPSWERRARLLDRVAAGDLAEHDLPRDLLTTLLRNQERYGLDDDQIARETAFYLEAGADTNAQALTNSMDFILDHIAADPSSAAGLADDLFLIQRFVHEAVRLRPTVPQIRRRASADTSVCGRPVAAGTVVELDAEAANRDVAVFGPDAGEFNPWREVPAKVPRYAHAFGSGAHACIGRTLAVGLPVPAPEERPDDHLHGVVPLMVQALLRRGVRRDPAATPVPDRFSTRETRWSRYPVVFSC
ncbi:hypothetical protein BU204_25660 [Actinophytocola xanthii]|uniref:Cytochrome n=2 Tax=Actinophytocola xanthii TaxID=1912961 RepID=A0A1Q8CJZ9_9PSEU|nr:hypothetical protein BU204_25660 [Actinophytocola xanthii]